MTRKKTAITSIVIFVAVFAILLTVATFTDFQISTILTSKALANHTYITNDAFGAAFEAIGSVPVYFMFALGFEVLALGFIRLNEEKKAWKTILAVVCVVAGVIANYVLTSDVVGYLLKHILSTDHLGDAGSAGYLKVIEFFFAVILAFFETMAINNFSDESIKKLMKWATAAIVAGAVASLIPELIKSPVGRIRYRAMNLYPENKDYGFAAFARWYERNGAKWSEMFTREERIAIFGSTDTFKSFPSGHTCAAGASYSLIALNKALNIKNKGVRALLWICPILFTATVAISRIVVGAHFFSDVLVGGTIAFVCAMITREIFVCKGENVKAIFSK